MEDIEKYYKLLGIGAGATLDDIKEAFREAEQSVMQDLQSEDPEKKGTAQERLHEIYEAHEKVMKSFMEHEPPKSTDSGEERERIHEVADTIVASEPGTESSTDTAEIVKEAEDSSAPIISTPLENLLANNAVILVVIICLVSLVAVSAGLLIGIAAFKKSAKATVPPQPVQQAVMTSTRAYKPIASAQKSVMQQAPVSGEEEKTAPIVKRYGKKMAKKRKHAAPHHVTRMSGKNPEDTMKAAAQGDAEAQYRLGTLYARGEGVKKDREEANKWFRRAARQGHPKARDSLEFIYE